MSLRDMLEQGAEAGAPCSYCFNNSQLNSNHSRSSQVTVPGASAKTYSGKGVFASSTSSSSSDSSSGLQAVFFLVLGASSKVRGFCFNT